MIYPIPPGVDPATHRCGCGGDFRMPRMAFTVPTAWPNEDELEFRVVLICRTDETHDTYQPKYTGKRHLWRSDGTQVEVHMATGRETSELAPISDQNTAMAAVRRSIAIGQFSGQQTEVQIVQIAQLALAYRLDPMQEEIIPMYGKPYITIKGRRRLDAAAGNIFGMVWKVPDADFLAYYQSVGAIDKGDTVAVAVGTYPDHPDMPTEVWARCKVTEKAGNSPDLPVNAWRLEMAQKRCERKLREQMFGPIPKPMGLEHIEVLQEGDETNIVDSTSRVVEDAPETDSPSLPEYGECPVHLGQYFKTKEQKYGLLVSHKNTEQVIAETGQDWCRLAQVLKDQFLAAWKIKYPDQAEGKLVNKWYKDNYDGNTWSGMTPEQWYDALARMRVDTATGELLADESDPGPDIDDDGPELTQEKIDADYARLNH